MIIEMELKPDNYKTELDKAVKYFWKIRALAERLLAESR
jgi:hypothetical protein